MNRDVKFRVYYPGFWQLWDTQWKIHLDGMLIGVGSNCKGFAVDGETSIGTHILYVTNANGSAKASVSFPEPGSYEIRLCDIETRTGSGYKLSDPIQPGRPAVMQQIIDGKKYDTKTATLVWAASIFSRADI